MNGTRPGDRTVVVPYRPGPLVRLVTAAGRRPRTPGAFEATAVLGGAALTTWGAVGEGPSWIRAVGPAVVLLGLVAPARAGVRELRRRAARLRRRRAERRGVLLEVADPLVDQLTDAHGDLIGRNGSRARRALAAAHLVVLDVAVLLAGRSVLSALDRLEVERAVHAVRDLTEALERGGGRSRALAAARRELAAHDTTLRHARATVEDL